MVVKACAKCSKEFRHPRWISRKLCSTTCRIKWTPENLLIKYNNKVIRNRTGCWGWNSSRADGYAVITYSGKQIKAHRFAWEIERGPIPEGLYVLHHCDTRDCSKITHLFLGTHADNMRDMIAKGRDNFGIGAKLTDEQVIEIKELLRNGSTITELSHKFGVGKTTIGSIRIGSSYKHLVPRYGSLEKIKGAKLIPEDVRTIRKLLNRFTPIDRITKKFEISRDTVFRIQNGRAWKHIK